jgi:hypothetical protein
MNRRSGGHGGVRELEALEGTCAANLIILSIISLLEALEGTCAAVTQQPSRVTHQMVSGLAVVGNAVYRMLGKGVSQQADVRWTLIPLNCPPLESLREAREAKSDVPFTKRVFLSLRSPTRQLPLLANDVGP